MPKDSSRAHWSHLRLKDRLEHSLEVLLVGINPGVQSALTGHHFAGFSNRFWKLLFESGLVPEPITHRDDARLPEFGIGVTNLVARPSPGSGDLKPAEYLAGWETLERKIRRYRPRIVALVGVTLYRALLPALVTDPEVRKDPRARVPGLVPITIHGARLFVLPNPSGRNANYSYAEMLASFRALREAIRDSSGGAGRSRAGS
jgi:TDG/mug DNA glycosylase family protein